MKYKWDNIDALYIGMSYIIQETIILEIKDLRFFQKEIGQN